MLSPSNHLFAGESRILPFWNWRALTGVDNGINGWIDGCVDEICTASHILTGIIRVRFTSLVPWLAFALVLLASIRDSTE
jgi:hypothetical protein